MTTDNTQTTDHTERRRTSRGTRSWRWRHTRQGRCQHVSSGLITTAAAGRRLAFCQDCNTFGTHSAHGDFIAL